MWASNTLLILLAYLLISDLWGLQLKHTCHFFMHKFIDKKNFSVRWYVFRLTNLKVIFPFQFDMLPSNKFYLVYLGPWQTLMMDLFYKNCWRLKAVNYFAKKTLSSMIARVGYCSILVAGDCNSDITWISMHQFISSDCNKSLCNVTK